MASLGKRVLMIGGEGVSLFGPSGRGIEREAAISWQVPNFKEQLQEALVAKNAGKPVLVLFDGADQTYRREESIPKLSPIDRPKFIKRKLDLAFPSYPIRAYLEVKPLKEKGVRTKALPAYLFVALPETEQLDEIGEVLFESASLVSGFGLLPAEAPGLVKEMSAKLFGKNGRRSRWVVLIGQHETGGLRQVVVKDGNLALTRLTPPTEAGTHGAAWAEEVIREFKATLTYVARFGYTADDGLDVIVVAGDVEKQFFDQKALAATNFRCLNITEALKLIGMRAASLEKTNFVDVLHAAWVGQKRSLALPIKVPSIHRVIGPRQGARAASAALVLVALGIAGYTVYDHQIYTALLEEVEQKQNQKSLLDREYEQEAKIFDALPVKPEIVKGVLAAKETLEINTFTLGLTLNRLRTALGVGLELEEMEVEHMPSSALALGDFTRRNNVVDALTDGAAPAGEDRGQVKISFRYTLAASMELEQKVVQAETLLTTLRTAFPGYKVEITKQFGNMSRKGRFSGGTGNEEKQNDQSMDQAEFEMEGAPL